MKTELNTILKYKPSYILSIDHDSGYIFEDENGINTNNEYLAEFTIQYVSLISNAYLSLSVECLVSITNNRVNIVECDTCCDCHILNANNIQGIDNSAYNLYDSGLDEAIHNRLTDIIDSLNVDSIPHIEVESI